MNIDTQSLLDFATNMFAVIIGGVITWYAQRQVFKREDERRKQDVAEEDLATAQTILFKLQSIVNSFSFVKKDLELARSRLPTGNELWTRFPPSAHGISTVDLDYREVHLLMQHRHFDVVSDYDQAIQWVKNLEQSITVHRSLFLELSKHGVDSMVGNIGEIILTDQNRELLPLASNLETLVRTLEEVVNSQYPDVENLLLSYCDIMHGMVGQRPTLTIDGINR